MITHHEITAGLWLLVFASGGVAGQFAYWRSLRRKLDDEWQDGYEFAWDEHDKYGCLNDVPRPGDSGGRAAEVPSLATMDGPVTRPGRLLSAGERAQDALKDARHDHADAAAPLVYAIFALSDQVRTTGGAIIEQLERIDDALRNTVGGSPR